MSPDHLTGGHVERRQAVTEVAARLLSEEGPKGVTLRKLAAAAGGSTQLIYTLFGGMPGVANALFLEGFTRLEAAQAAALRTGPPPGDPERLVLLGLAYRRFALDEPAFFAVMFGRIGPDFAPGPSALEAGARTLATTARVVRECLDAGTIQPRDEAELTLASWATAHGIASLEAAGQLFVADPDAFAERFLRDAVSTLLPNRSRQEPTESRSGD